MRKTRWMNVVAFALAVVLLQTAVPVMAAENNQTSALQDQVPEIGVAIKTVASGKCGAKATWKLTNDGVLTISGSGPVGNYNYSYYSGSTDAPWGEYKDDIYEIVVKRGITSIGKGAFVDFDNVYAITFPATLQTIGEAAMVGCDGIESVRFPSKVTSVGDMAFGECSNLRGVTLSANLTKIGKKAFCKTALETVTIPGKVKDMGESAFEECKSLHTVTVKTGVTTIGKYAFRYCENLKTVALPDGLKSIGRDAFNGCNSLELYLPDTITIITEYSLRGFSALYIPVSVNKIEYRAVDDLGHIYYVGTKAQWQKLKDNSDYSCPNVDAYNLTFNAVPFLDIKHSGSDYTAVAWAYKNHIVTGTTSTTFGPRDGLTRAQFVMMLYRFAGKPPVKDVNMRFTDVSANKGYYDAVKWAYGEGIIKGTSKTTFSPGTKLTRGQIAIMLYRYAGSPVVSGKMPFTDLKPTSGAFKPVLWAVKNGIVGGSGKYQSAATCTRQMMVNMLYAYNNSTK